jgi:hypothetical protein
MLESILYNIHTEKNCIEKKIEKILFFPAKFNISYNEE